MNRNITPCHSFIGLIFIIVLSIFLGYLEIQIEGTAGWAKNLPTWRYNIYGFQMTGYHCSLWCFLFIFIHIPFIFTSWNIYKECFLLSIYIMILLMEDAVWFLLNKNFCGNDDWRDPKLFRIIPLFYFIGAFVTICLSCATFSYTWILSTLFILILIFISFFFQHKSCSTAIL